MVESVEHGRRGAGRPVGAGRLPVGAAAGGSCLGARSSAAISAGVAPLGELMRPYRPPRPSLSAPCESGPRRDVAPRGAPFALVSCSSSCASRCLIRLRLADRTRRGERCLVRAVEGGLRGGGRRRVARRTSAGRPSSPRRAASRAASPTTGPRPRAAPGSPSRGPRCGGRRV